MRARPFNNNITMSGRPRAGDGARRTRARLGILIAQPAVVDLLVLSTATQTAQAVGERARARAVRRNVETREHRNGDSGAMNTPARGDQPADTRRIERT
jgi:hypothetical protein